MARIAGVNIPNQKRVPIALTYIHGIGRTKALEICNRVGIPLDRRANDMTDDDQAIALPWASLIVIIVLLNVAFTCAVPEVMFLRSRRRRRGAAAVLAI